MNRPRLLVVDDEADIRDLVALNFAVEGFDVLTAANGEDAEKIPRAERPDVVILDIMMPGRDGLQVLGSLKADPGTRAIPVVLLTAEPNPVVAQRRALDVRSPLEAIPVRLDSPTSEQIQLCIPHGICPARTHGNNLRRIVVKLVENTVRPEPEGRIEVDLRRFSRLIEWSGSPTTAGDSPLKTWNRSSIQSVPSPAAPGGSLEADAPRGTDAAPRPRQSPQ